jgi:hypothetical protein
MTFVIHLRQLIILLLRHRQESESDFAGHLCTLFEVHLLHLVVFEIYYHLIMGCIFWVKVWLEQLAQLAILGPGVFFNILDVDLYEK